MTGKHPKRKPRPGVDGLGRTPLHYAAADRKTDLLRELLASGAEPNTADNNGWTPLHFACQAWDPEAVRALLAAGAHIDPINSHGNTPLMLAVSNSRGRGDVIMILRAAGADPNRANAYGISPVSSARMIANFDIRQYFNDIPDSRT